MTVPLSARQVAQQINQQFPKSVSPGEGDQLVVAPAHLVEVAHYLKGTPGLELDYLANLSGVDFWDYFGVVYHLVSLKYNHSLVLRVQCPGRENPTVPSVTGIWRGADFQERETYDLLGIRFTGHPNLKRLLLWEGFPGHPLRKDWL